MAWIRGRVPAKNRETALKKIRKDIKSKGYTAKKIKTNRTRCARIGGARISCTYVYLALGKKK